MHAPEYNLKLARAMLDEFEDYLLSNELFWPLDPSALRDVLSVPRFTPGVLILVLDELNVQNIEMTTVQQTEHQKINLQMQHVLRMWPEAIGRKAAREMHSRLNLWKAYVNDLTEKIDRPDSYANEVRHRVIFERISELAARQTDAETTIQNGHLIDVTLQGIFKPGEFIWDPRLRTIYTQDPYWFLYGVPELSDSA